VSAVSAKRGRPRHPDVLTPAEWEVVDAVRHGMSGPEIARRRGVSRDAVKYHVANALVKLGLSSRAELRAWRGVPAGSALIRRGAAAPSNAARSNAAPLNRKEDTMSDDDLRLGPIGQISRHVSDLGVAVEWYGKVLGLPHLYTFGDLAFFDCGGVRLFLSSEGNGNSAQESVLYFRVPDINAAYDTLTARGVTFEGAPHMIHRHESGLEEWMAFFPDPDGRLLAIMSQIQG
jgi:DNA-binding CsgD family transcriptional regulator/catechol 2,3-dioxygenase-like lactoylglutathione lyase family enzyme